MKKIKSAVSYTTIITYIFLVFLLAWHHHFQSSRANGITIDQEPDIVDIWLLNESTCIFSFTGAANILIPPIVKDSIKIIFPIVQIAIPQHSTLKQECLTFLNPLRGPPRFIF